MQKPVAVRRRDAALSCNGQTKPKKPKYRFGIVTRREGGLQGGILDCIVHVAWTPVGFFVGTHTHGKARTLTGKDSMYSIVVALLYV